VNGRLVFCARHPRCDSGSSSSTTVYNAADLARCTVAISVSFADISKCASVVNSMTHRTQCGDTTPIHHCPVPPRYTLHPRVRSYPPTLLRTETGGPCTSLARLAARCIPDRRTERDEPSFIPTPGRPCIIPFAHVMIHLQLSPTQLRLVCTFLDIVPPYRVLTQCHRFTAATCEAGISKLKCSGIGTKTRARLRGSWPALSA
jgi:hypothetical protein